MTASGARSRPVWRAVNGILLLDKPIGLSSNDALQRVRRALSAKKAGHTGSLDPLASGLLPLCFGEATKVAGLLLDADKTYQATVALGSRTTTGDAEGSVVQEAPVPELDVNTITRVMTAFIGEQQQIPPMFSALKREGQPLYKLARRGIEVEREARAIRIDQFRLLHLEGTQLSFEVACSKGTYVRTLAEDLAVALGTVGHLVALRRTALGRGFDGRVMHRMDAIEAAAGVPGQLDSWLIPADVALVSWPRVTLDEFETRSFTQGQAVSLAAPMGARVRVYGPKERLLGLGQSDALGVEVRPVRLWTEN
jgi:tRNA pseudouridine55 synthase